MPDYLTMTHVTGNVPEKILIEALDEDGDGAADAAAWARVARDVKAEIDTALEQSCAVPFENPLPALVVEAAHLIAVEKIYALSAKRRGDRPAAVNPFAARTANMRAMLKQIGLGNAQLYARRDVPVRTS